MLIYTDSMTRHIGSFQIPFLALYPLLIDQKISLFSLARYAISGQSDMETNSSRYSFIRMQFEIDYHLWSFIHRQGTVQG